MTEDKRIPDDRPVKLVDIAAQLGVSAAGIRKYVLRRGFKPFKLQEGQSKPWFLAYKDAQALIERVEEEKHYRFAPEQETAPAGLSGVYAVELPAYDAAIRLKIGWSDNIVDRLNTYRGLVPDLRVLRIWPCSESWAEQMALKWARHNGRQIGEEVFEFEDNAVAVSSLDDVFGAVGIKPQK